MPDKITVKGQEYDEVATWPELEKKAKAALSTLKKHDLYTDSAVSGTPNDAAMEVFDAIELEDEPEKFKGYVFYCDDAERDARLGDPLLIDYGAYNPDDPFTQDDEVKKQVKNLAMDAFREEGLKVEPVDEFSELLLSL